MGFFEQYAQSQINPMKQRLAQQHLAKQAMMPQMPMPSMAPQALPSMPPATQPMPKAPPKQPSMGKMQMANAQDAGMQPTEAKVAPQAPTAVTPQAQPTQPAQGPAQPVNPSGGLVNKGLGVQARSVLGDIQAAAGDAGNDINHGLQNITGVDNANQGLQNLTGLSSLGQGGNNLYAGVAGAGNWLNQNTGSNIPGYLTGVGFVNDYWNKQNNINQAQQDENAAAAQAAISQGNLNAISDQMGNVYQSYLKDMPTFQTQLQQGVNSGLRQQLAQNIVAAKNSAASRGLGGGGASQQAQADAAYQANSNWQDAQGQINTQLQNQAKSLQDLQTNTKLQGAGLQGQEAQQFYSNQLADIQNQASGFAQIGQAGGTILGAYLGNQAAKPGYMDGYLSYGGSPFQSTVNPYALSNQGSGLINQSPNYLNYNF